MQQERFVVYEVIDPQTSERREVSGHWTLERAFVKAKEHTTRTGLATTIDWQLESITRDGREILEAEADIEGVKP